MYCKECIYANILSQKKDIKRAKKQFEEQQKDLAEKEEEKKHQKKEDEIAAFGKAELGILPETHYVFKARGDSDTTATTTATSSSTELVTFQGTNSKDNISMVANAADPDKEKLKLNSFWVPSLTPHAAPKLLEAPKLEIMCLEGNHPIRLKQLIKVNFVPVSKMEKADPKHNARFCCPVCRRTLTDAYKSILLKSCGHVMCLACCEKFKDEKICTACDTPFKKDYIIKLQSGGTGYSAHDERIIAKKEASNAWV